MRRRRGGTTQDPGQGLLFDSVFGPEDAPPPPPPPAPTPARRRAAPAPLPEQAIQGDLVSDQVVAETFGQDVRGMLDPSRWDPNPDPAEMFQRVGEQARRAVERERAMRAPLRTLLQDLLSRVPNPPPQAGLHRVTEADLERVARSYLYNGLTEAVAGDFVIHETVPLSIGQAGVCVVGYSGRHNQWHQRLVRREIEINLTDPVEAVEAMLEQRDHLRRPGGPDRLQQLSDLARRGFVSYMERSIMLRECPDRWRMGYGVPAPLDLLTGMGNMTLLEMSLELLRDLLLGDPRWVWVSGTSPEPALETLVGALEPLELVIVARQHHRLAAQVEQGRYPAHYGRMAEAFVDEVAPHLVLGAFRAGDLCPPRFFVAHAERALTAGLIAMADAIFTQPQGVPALAQLARSSARSALGGDNFEQVVRQAYREAGAPEWFDRGTLR